MMNVISKGPLTQPFGQKSLSSGLATALKVAAVILTVAFALAATAAAVGIPLCILVATHVVSAQVLNGPGYNMLSTWTTAIPYLIYAAVTTGGALLIVRRLRRVFASFVADDPFARDNAAHLRTIWVTLVVIEITRIVGFVCAHTLTTVFASSAEVVFPHELEDPLDLVRLFLIFVVLILAEVFRKGTQLRDETQLTV
jgi:hypothetical protein